MEPFRPFDMWRDYLGLAAVLARLRQERQERRAAASKALCVFCKHNGEAKHVYTAHNLKGAGGRVECPVLRSYVCPQCGATQDGAHTRRFCPLTRRGYTSVYRSSAAATAGRAPRPNAAAGGRPRYPRPSPPSGRQAPATAGCERRPAAGLGTLASPSPSPPLMGF